MKPKRLNLVVPCFNEEAVLPETISRLLALLDDLTARKLVSADSAMTFVDDGSRDGTWEIIETARARDARVGGIRLSINRGHQHALLAGLLNAPGEVLISLDAVPPRPIAYEAVEHVSLTRDFLNHREAFLRHL